MKTVQKTNKSRKRQRDKDGNIIFPKPNLDWGDFRRWQATHVFEEWDENRKIFRPIILILTSREFQEKAKDFKRQGIILHELFPFPDKPETKDFQYDYWLRECAYIFFKEVFKYHSVNAEGMTSFDITKVVIREKQFDEIQQLIAEYKLEKVGGLIFFIIAMIQKTYLRDVERYERPERVVRLNNFDKEVDMLISVIDRIAKNEYRIDFENLLPDLASISFVFPDTGPIKISDPHLSDSIIEAVKEYYAKRPFKDWRKELEKLKSFNKEDLEKQKFRFRVAIALHNFFTYLNAFPVKKGTMTSNTELLCIAKILEHGLIKIGNGFLSDAQKIKNVRNYLNPERYELKTYPTHGKLKSSLKKLDKYFDKAFLNCTSLVKPMELLLEAGYITKRFDLEHLQGEIAHLMDCLKQRHFQIGHQFSMLDQSTQKDPLLETLHNLVSSASGKNGKKQLSELSFKIEGEPATQTINERLPLQLIERAIAEYRQNHQEEFDFDIFESQITDEVQKHRYKADSLGKYREQKDRFLPQFCNGMYQFLLKEAPPKEEDYSATEKYSLIIAVLLQRCWVFGNMMDDEHVIQQKVKQWLQDAK